MDYKASLAQRHELPSRVKSRLFHQVSDFEKRGGSPPLVDRSRLETERTTSVVQRVRFNNFAAGLNIRGAADFCIGRNSSIPNPHQVFPVPEIAFDSQDLPTKNSGYTRHTFKLRQMRSPAYAKCLPMQESPLFFLENLFFTLSV